MKRTLLTTLALAAVGAALSACGGGGKDKNVVVTTPAPASPFEDQFGAAGFGPAFRAGLNTEPRDIAPGDLIPVSLTAEPVMLPGT